MTESPRKVSRRPGPGAVLWGSVALFAVLFALLTHQLSASSQAGAGSTASARPELVRKVVKRRVVTTVVPSPGATTVSAGPVTTSSEPAPEPVVTSAS